MSSADKPDAVETFVEKTDRDYQKGAGEKAGRPEEAEDIEASESDGNRRIARDGETYKDPKSL